MSEKISFGKYVSQKRHAAGLSIREFCDMVSLSPSFVCSMENDKSAAPSAESQLAIAAALQLTAEERALMFDLAVDTKKDGTVPSDIAEYITSDADVKAFLRQAKSQGLMGKDLLKLM